ncbi:unnamed protein product [Enterobius vermicularis]|uniref:BMERB domain-containing protein n=1 Tax=Enterobius vermicularis TaxID=51028 RepID=A0A0N4VAI3_ENTVE|nr:unnamed protein product [Enterobius vermicularis]
MEKEIDRLNREIDEIKMLKKRDEEELINEWKEKLMKKQKEFEETKDVLQKVEALTENIRNISAKVSNESERTAIEREAKLTEREHLIEFREQRYFIWK